jgi:dephospho-CoA kinase
MNKYPIKIGVTGSIGMGKTTVSNEIGKYNFPVWNADNAIHFLYQKGNRGYDIIKKIAPEVVTNDYVDRTMLSNLILKNPSLLPKIKNHIYPLLDINRSNFIKINNDKKLLVFDIPLLFENSCEKWLDFVIVVTAPASIQKKRVLSRKFMTEDKFKYLLSKQQENEEKVNRGDFVLDTNVTFLNLSIKVKDIIESILKRDD